MINCMCLKYTFHKFQHACTRETVSTVSMINTSVTSDTELRYERYISKAAKLELTAIVHQPNLAQCMVLYMKFY